MIVRPPNTMIVVRLRLFSLFILLVARHQRVQSWVVYPSKILLPGTRSYTTTTPTTTIDSRFHCVSVLGSKLTVEDEKVESPQNLDETTQKYGLEAGLFQSLKTKDGGESAKSLLKKYGIAYLATSIPLAIISFVLCYILVDSGVDVAALLSKVGINVTSGDTSEKVGTFAIAYAAHKAASPIRFPPTVLLTPIVAKMIGKEPESDAN